ncbi:MAG: GyrI-like domain-containing protein [Bacteroidales bacterium]
MRLKIVQDKNCMLSIFITIPVFSPIFNPQKEFEKWATVEVSDFNDVPDGMDTLLILAGRCVVFHYKGKTK